MYWCSGPVTTHRQTYIKSTSRVHQSTSTITSNKYIRGQPSYPRAGDNLLSFFTTADCASRVTLCSRPWETRLQARLQSTLRSYMFSGAPSELGRHRNWPRHRSRRNSLPTPLAAPGARGEGHIASGATASHARRLRQPRQSTPRSPRTFRVAPRRARSAPKAASLNAPAPPARGMWAHDRARGRT